MSGLNGGVQSSDADQVIEVNGVRYRLLAKRSLPSDLPNADTEWELTLVDQHGLNPPTLPELGILAYLLRYPSLPVGVVLAVIGSIISIGPETWRMVAWAVMTAVGWSLLFSTPKRSKVNEARKRGEER